MPNVDHEYLMTAVQAAVGGLPGKLERHDLGSLQSWEVHRVDGHGWFLTVLIASKRHDGAIVRNRGLVLPAAGPDKDAETTGMVYAVGLIERLFKPSHDAVSKAEPIDLH